MFSAYLMDPEHGWTGIHRLPLASAIASCKDHRTNWAGSRVAIVPDGEDPTPYLERAVA